MHRPQDTLNIIFWTVAALDAALFIGLCVNIARTEGGTSSGGREMGMFFFGVVPLVLLPLASLLFYFSVAPEWKYLALAAVLGPGLFYAKNQIRHALVSYRVRQHRKGRGASGSA